MHQLKTYKLILCIAALLFIAKPFVGFKFYVEVQSMEQQSSLWVKVFTQRKPEFIDEAASLLKTYQVLIKEKAQHFNLLLCALFGGLFPFLARLLKRAFTLPAYSGRVAVTNTPIFLLTRQLTI